MKKKQKKQSIFVERRISPRLTANSLMGKQSVRTSFRLPTQIIDLLSIAASQLGLKQKSLFDHLIEDNEVLHRVAQEEKDSQPTECERRQKTYVISRSSLSSLSQVAKKYHMPRDVLVEYSIKRLFPVMNDEHEKQDKRKVILKEVKSYLEEGKKLLHKSTKLLGEEDPVSLRLAELVDICGKSVMELDEVVEKGKRLDSFF